tara:strand:- start:644 stop:964 length:321 start_codon:yes stop_codon:yes gene_type:complete
MGTCLKDTFCYLSNKANKNDYTIIHAIVERKSDNLRHPHSVIYNKITGDIHDVSNNFKKKNVVMPFILWIKLGKVSNIVQYSFEEYNKNLLKYNTWDFWDLTNSGF